MSNEATKTEDETPDKATRRSALKRELDSLIKLVEILRSLSSEQRTRLLADAAALMGKSEE